MSSRPPPPDTAGSAPPPSSPPPVPRVISLRLQRQCWLAGFTLGGCPKDGDSCTRPAAVGRGGTPEEARSLQPRAARPDPREAAVWTRNNSRVTPDQSTDIPRGRGRENGRRLGGVAVSQCHWGSAVAQHGLVTLAALCNYGRFCRRVFAHRASPKIHVHGWVLRPSIRLKRMTTNGRQTCHGWTPTSIPTQTLERWHSARPGIMSSTGIIGYIRSKAWYIWCCIRYQLIMYIWRNNFAREVADSGNCVV